jgi:hypothetical protein
MLTQLRYVPGKDGVSLGRFQNRNPLRAGNLQHRGVEDELGGELTLNEQYCSNRTSSNGKQCQNGDYSAAAETLGLATAGASKSGQGRNR